MTMIPQMIPMMNRLMEKTGCDEMAARIAVMRYGYSMDNFDSMLADCQFEATYGPLTAKNIDQLHAK